MSNFTVQAVSNLMPNITLEKSFSKLNSQIPFHFIETPFRESKNRKLDTIN